MRALTYQDMSQRRSLQIQQDDKFFSRLLSKESSTANPSSRVLYYADRPSSVPFLWESQPGTPKTSTFRDEYCHPPLTPPPSYYFKRKFVENSGTDNSHVDLHHHRRRENRKRSRPSNLLGLLFPKKFNVGIIKIKAGQWIPSLSSESTVLDSATVRSGSTATTSWFSSSSSSFDSRGDEEGDVIGADDGSHGSPDSTLCVGCYRG